MLTPDGSTYETAWQNELGTFAVTTNAFSKSTALAINTSSTATTAQNADADKYSSCIALSKVAVKT